MHFHYWRLCVSCLPVLLLTMAAGMSVNYIAVVFQHVNEDKNGIDLSEDSEPWLSGMTLLLAVPGSLITAPIMDTLGRKFTIVITTVPMAIGWFLIVAAFNLATFAIGKAIIGVAFGMVLSTVFVYVTEVSPQEVRGFLSSCVSLFLEMGSLLVCLMGFSTTWRWTAFIPVLITAITSFIIYFMYETPRWLLSKGDRDSAIEHMKLLWEMDDFVVVSREITIMEENLKLVQSSSFTGAITKLFRSPQNKLLLVALLLMLFQQLTGIAFINSYSSSIFNHTVPSAKWVGINLKDPSHQKLLQWIAELAGHIISALTVDFIGRRLLLIASSAIQTLSLAVAGVYYYLQHTNEDLAAHCIYWLPLACFLIFNLAYGLGFGNIPYFLVGELMPLHVRSTASSLAMVNRNVWRFLVIKVFFSVNLVPLYGVIWIYAVIALISFFFVFYFVPDPTGRSLEEFQLEWFIKHSTEAPFP